ncbi:unnamed protein product [Caretta caretta]
MLPEGDKAFADGPGISCVQAKCGCGWHHVQLRTRGWGLEFCALITDDINFIWTVAWVGRPKKGSEPPTSTMRVEGAQHLTGSSPCSDPFPAVQRIAPALPFLSIPPRVKPSNDLRAHAILHPCNSANQTRLRQI